MLKSKWFVLSIGFLAVCLIVLCGAEPGLTPPQRGVVWFAIALLAVTNLAPYMFRIVKEYLPQIIESVVVFWVRSDMWIRTKIHAPNSRK